LFIRLARGGVADMMHMMMGMAVAFQTAAMSHLMQASGLMKLLMGM
jgi:hypothetical protein